MVSVVGTVDYIFSHLGRTLNKFVHKLQSASEVGLS